MNEETYERLTKAICNQLEKASSLQEIKALGELSLLIFEIYREQSND